MMNEENDAVNEASIAEAFVRARLSAQVLKNYPGRVPPDLPSAYRCQDAAIARWPEPVGGWKASGRWPPTLERVVGPAFRSNIRSARPGQVVECPVFGGGIVVIEPEVIVRVGRDAPPKQTYWTTKEGAELVGEMCIGAEVASSPLPTLIGLGSTSTASDFGCNCGIVVGSPIPDWRTRNEIKWQIYIEDRLAGEVTRFVTSALEAFAFVLGKCAGRGHPLRAGMVIATGAHSDIVTPDAVPPDPSGVGYRLENLELGQSVRAVFEGIGDVTCRVVQAGARPHVATG